MRRTRRDEACAVKQGSHVYNSPSFYLRVKTASGAMFEACTETALPIAEIVAMLENEYLGYMRAMGRESRDEGTMPNRE
jgi:hypothetical protein